MEKKIILLLILIPIVFGVGSTFDVSLNLIGDNCYDGIQNQDETGVDCGSICPPCSEFFGGSGGGGGGTSYTETYFSIEDNDTIVEEVDIEELPVTNIELWIQDDVVNVTINVFLTENMPQNISDYVYSTFKVSASNMNLDNIKHNTISFRVNKTWVDDQDVTFSEIALLNFETEWIKFDTKFINEDDTFYYFKADGKRIGSFAIVGIKKKPPTLKQRIEKPIQVMKDMPRENPILFFFIILVLIVAVYHLYNILRKKSPNFHF